MTNVTIVGDHSLVDYDHSSLTLIYVCLEKGEKFDEEDFMYSTRHPDALQYGNGRLRAAANS